MFTPLEELSLTRSGETREKRNMAGRQEGKGIKQFDLKGENISKT